LGKTLNKNTMAYKMKGFGGFKSSPAKQKITTIKHGKYKGHTKEVYKKGEEGYAGKGRGVVIKDKHNRVVETRGKGFKRTKKDEQQKEEINEMLSGKRPWPKKSPVKQEGPIDEKQLKLQPSENPDTWVYEPGERVKKDKKWVRQEKIIGLEDRIGFIDEDVNASGKPKTEQQKKDQAKLKQELAILRKSKHK